MSIDSFGDSLWDEFKWESHLEEVEKRSEQLRRFIAGDYKGDVPRWLMLLKESLSEDDVFEAFIEEELLLDEAYFPDEDEDEEDDFDEEDFLFGSDEFDSGLFGEYDDLDDDDDDDDFDEGEEWKSLSEDFALSDYGSIDNMALFNQARETAIDILRWAEALPHQMQTAPFLDFVSNSLKIGAKLAGGYSFGFEPEYLGANIVYTKKALYYANQALAKLQKLKQQGIFTKKIYTEFHNALFELRNDIGVYIQELRDRFYNR